MIQVKTHYRDVLPHWALRQMRGNERAPGLALTNIFMFIYLQIIGWFYLLKCIAALVPSRYRKVQFQSFFFCFGMGKCPPGISATSAKSTLLSISCSNTFFIDLYQRLCLQSESGRARYNIAWHKILSVCQRRQLLPSAKQNKLVIVHLHHLSNVRFMRKVFRRWQAANQPVFCFDRFLDVDWAERITAMILFWGYATITRGKTTGDPNSKCRVDMGGVDK